MESLSLTRPSTARILPPAARAPAVEASQERRIEGLGTSESAWQAWEPLSAAPLVSLDTLVPRGARPVVVAPHPDDEILACGGLLSLLAARPPVRADDARPDAPPVLMISVTDGEASHPGSRRWSPHRLAVQRRAERAVGLRQLGLNVPVFAAGLPDGGVTANEEELVLYLLSLFQPGDVVFTTWRLDGHPDHEATGRACARAAMLAGCRLVEIPVWAWHWAKPADARVPWQRLRRLPLDARALECKRTAITAHQSQLQPDEERPPVLSAGAVDRLMRPFEYVFMPDTQS